MIKVLFVFGRYFWGLEVPRVLFSVDPRPRYHINASNYLLSARTYVSIQQITVCLIDISLSVYGFISISIYILMRSCCSVQFNQLSDYLSNCLEIECVCIVFRISKVWQLVRSNVLCYLLDRLSSSGYLFLLYCFRFCHAVSSFGNEYLICIRSLAIAQI